MVHYSWILKAVYGEDPAAGAWLEWHRKLKHKSGVERGFEGSMSSCKDWEKWALLV